MTTTAPRVALVTGGTRGIGRAVVEALVSRGWRVAFTWNSDRVRAEELERASSGSAKAYPMDLRDRMRPGTLLREVEADLGPVHGLVNNAGTRKDGLLAMTSDADWDHVLEVDLSGVFRCCRAVLPGMLRRRAGSIVSVSSLSAMHGVAGQTAYAAAKAGVLGLTRALAREVGKRGIRVNAVVPGYVATDFVADLPAAAVAALRAGEALPSGVPPAAVAETVAFLLSDAAGAITGQAMVVDAGSSA